MYDMSIEKNCWMLDQDLVGIDEAGYGCAYGSMWVAAVVFPRNFTPTGDMLRVRDSKRTTAEERVRLSAAIRAAALRYTVAEITAAEIDAGNVYDLRFSRIHADIQSWPPSTVIFDGNHALSGGVHTNQCLVKGDNLCLTIAAASILAKSAKDAEMAAAEKLHPGYGLGSNQGYLSPSHIQAIKSAGVTAGHRRSYCKKILQGSAEPERQS